MGIKSEWMQQIASLRRWSEAQIAVARRRWKAMVAVDRARSPEAAHMAREEWFWAASLAISVFTSLTALVAIYFSSAAFTAARRQADAADIQNRAWIKIDASIGPKGLFHDDDEASDPILALDLKVENVGHSPALNMTHSFRLSTHYLHGAAMDQFLIDGRRLCAERSNADDGAGGVATGYAVVPGEQRSDGELFKLPENDATPLHRQYLVSLCTSYISPGISTPRVNERTYRIVFKASPLEMSWIDIPRGRIRFNVFGEGDYAD